MADFPGLILTNAGRQLQAKAQIGQQLQFTRVALGAGDDPDTPESLVALVDEKQSLSIQAFEVIGDGTSKIRAILTNEGVTTGFFVREIGVFARDPDTLEEQLYSYSNSGSQSDFLPAEGGATVVEQIFDLVTVVGNATNVTAVINDYITLATKSDLELLRTYILPAGGLAGQLLRKVSNAEGHTEWYDPDEALNIHIHSITEERIAVEGQHVFNLVETRAYGLAIYKNGKRIPPSKWQALNATQVRLNDACFSGDLMQFVNNEEVGSTSLARVSLTGPNLVYPGSSNTYTITDYDEFSAYTVATDVGSVGIVGESITLDIDAAESAGNLTLSVNRNDGSSSFVIAVGAQTVAAPEALNPANAAIDVGETPTLTTNAFKTYPIGVDTHTSTDWQVATDAAFSSVVWESLADTSNLESIQVPGSTLTESTAYYVRARHNGENLGASNWSSTISFTTSAQFVPDTAGTPFAGGYFVSRMLDEVGAEYALVLSPRAEGYMGSRAWQKALDLAANSAIGGYTDWKLPDRDEMTAIYWNFKPGLQENFTTIGASSRIIPATSNYTTSNPSQTDLVEFQVTKPETFEENTYWTSESYDSEYAYRHSFARGNLSTSNKTSGNYSRFIRRVYL